MERRAHKLELRARNKGSITGVSDVLCFDEEEIRLVTELGILSVKGKELHVTRLDLEKPRGRHCRESRQPYLRPGQGVESVQGKRRNDKEVF